MKTRTFLTLAAACLSASLLGCGGEHSHGSKAKDSAKAKGDAKAKEPAASAGHDHDGPGPNGGTIIEFGPWHGELVVDVKAKQATVHILGEDAKTVASIPADKLTLSIEEPKFQVELKASPGKDDPKGKASRFVAVHDHFGTERLYKGILSGKVGDLPPLAEEFQQKAPKKK